LVNKLVKTIEINEANIELVNDAINYLEMHEAEIKRVRQLLMLKARDHYIKSLKTRRSR
jgi:hypothetical protein